MSSPIQIFPISEAPYELRKHIPKKGDAPWAWVALLTGIGRPVFWGERGKPAAKGSLARMFDEGVLFEFVKIDATTTAVFMTDEHGAEA